MNNSGKCLFIVCRFGKWELRSSRAAPKKNTHSSESRCLETCHVRRCATLIMKQSKETHHAQSVSHLPQAEGFASPREMLWKTCFMVGGQSCNHGSTKRPSSVGDAKLNAPFENAPGLPARINDDVYFAAQLHEHGLADVEALGIKTIVDITQTPGDLLKQAEAAHLLFTHYPLVDGEWNSDQIDRLLAIIDASPKPVLVFCEVALRAAAVAVAFKASREAVLRVLAGTQQDSVSLITQEDEAVLDHLESTRPEEARQHKQLVMAYVQSKIKNAMTRPRHEKITDDFYYGGQVTDDELHEAKAAGIRSVLNLRESHEAGEFGVGMLAREEKTVRSIGLVYVQLPVPRRGPYSAELRGKVEAKLAEIISSSGPVLMHCRTGRRIREITQGTRFDVVHLRAYGAVKCSSRASAVSLHADFEHPKNREGSTPKCAKANPSDSEDWEGGSSGARARLDAMCPAFAQTEHLFDLIRRADFAQLERGGECTYLDYTGAALAPQSVLQAHFKLLTSNLLGNPHSTNAPSARATQHDNAARVAVLAFCNADPAEYAVIWTANSSAALKLVGESYPFSTEGAFVYAPDCHNSVLGISEFAKRKGAAVCGFKFGDGFTSSYDYADLERVLDAMAYPHSDRSSGHEPASSGSNKDGDDDDDEINIPDSSGRLLVVPAQSNVSGAKHQAQRIVQAAHARGYDVFLDTAALAPTSGLDLTEVRPEFACLSFYKMFGYPTGIGCLLAKKSALARLQRPWFAGGTVGAISAGPGHILPRGHGLGTHERWEDGTVNFQQTAAVQLGLEFLQRVGMHNVRAYTASLTAWLSAELRMLRWDNERPLCVIPDISDGEVGSTVSMLVLSRDNKAVPHKVMEAKAVAASFAVRTGWFCNPGSCLHVLAQHDPALADAHTLTTTFGQDFTAFAARYGALGLLRVSVGIPTSFEDCDRFLRFLRTEILAKPQQLEEEVRLFTENAATTAPSSFCAGSVG